MYERRVTEWLLTLTRPSTIEARYRDDIVDSVILTDESDCENLTEELLESIKQDAEEAESVVVIRENEHNATANWNVFEEDPHRLWVVVVVAGGALVLSLVRR